jgi:S1-C subfamily serine protease
MTHDLMVNLLSELGAELSEVVVHDLRNSTYFGALRLRVAGETDLRSVDCRPSDALALAVRSGAAIRVARRILVAPPTFDFTAPEGSGQVVHALGITVVAQTPALRTEFGLPERPGIVVTHVSGRALEEGLRRGDLIVEVGGTPIGEPIDFFDAVRAAAPGSSIRIVYWRDGGERILELPVEPVAPPRPGGVGPLVKSGPPPERGPVGLPRNNSRA